MARLLAVTTLLLFHALPARSADVSVSMMYSNATSGAQPYVLFEGKEWRAHERARFVKLHIYFDQPTLMTGFDLVPCKPDPALSELSFFINFDELMFQSAASKMREAEDERLLQRHKQEVAKARARALAKPAAENEDEDEGYVVTDGAARFTVRVMRSLTINFERKRGVRLCGMTLLDGFGAPHRVRVPRIVAGAVSASSTLEPADAYAAPNLFDSRFEYAWATNKVQRGAALDFAFAQPATISRLMVWNGYQRSPTHCLQNSRVKALRIESETGESAQVELADILGSQVVALPRPLRGTKFRFTVEQPYAGSVYQDLAISELRFGDEAGWYLIDASDHTRSIAAKNVQAFAAAGLERLLNDGYAGAELMRLRLRSDGSFYVSSHFYDKDNKEKAFYTLGGYEVLPGSKGRTLRLRLFGVYREDDVYGDCNGCGWDCNAKDAEGRMRGRIFQQNVVLEAPDVSGQAERGVKLRTDGPTRLQLQPTPLNPEG